MLKQILEPYNPHHMKAAMATEAMWKKRKKVPPFVPNEIVVNEVGMKFRILDKNGAMVPLNWEEDQLRFGRVASAFAEEDTRDETLSDLLDEEELYDITPEDRKKIREHGGHV